MLFGTYDVDDKHLVNAKINQARKITQLVTVGLDYTPARLSTMENFFTIEQCHEQRGPQATS